MEFQFNTVQIQSQTINKSTSKRRANKKPATKPNRRQNDVYITTKSNFKAQQKRCEELLNAGIREIYLHCLGNAIIRGLNLALNLVNNSNNTLSYAINTSTVHLIDEYHPLYDHDEMRIERRTNSAVHIKINRNSVYDVDLAIEN
ncbi:hypothetical protein DOY81_008782 [Sarcophaga bullata]|nr:hypothetical protein DOY81_008782 [Sarcophaga bullata]